MIASVTTMDLLDTVPGRLFVKGIVYDYRRTSGEASRSTFLQSLSMNDLVWAATNDISSYLYSNGITAALFVDPVDPENVAIASELSPSRDTFTSAQHHEGGKRAPPSAAGHQQARFR